MIPPSPIVADINHHICQCKKNSGIILFVLSDDLIFEDRFFAEGEWFLSFWRCHRPRWGGRRWWCGVADSSLSLKPQTKGTVLLVCLWHIQTKRTVPLVCGLCGLLEIRYATSLTTGAKHWHRQKAVFSVFVSVPQYLSTEPFFLWCSSSLGIYKKETRTQRVSVRVWNI